MPDTVAPAAASIDLTCPRLPSSDSAYRLVVQRDPGALIYVARDLVGRAILIGAGMFVFGSEDSARKIMRNALAGAAGIEFFVLLWIWRQNGRSDDG